MILFLHVIDQGILAETNACGQQFVIYIYIYEYWNTPVNNVW